MMADLLANARRHARELRSCVPVTVGCLDCGGPVRLARPGVHHPACVTTVLACTECGAELALRVEVARITPPPIEVNERARAYRARKKQVA